MFAIKKALLSGLSMVAEKFGLDADKIRKAKLIVELGCSIGSIADLPSLALDLIDLLGRTVVKALLMGALKSVAWWLYYPIKFLIKLCE